jgi:outer membrane immunogenic protein
LFRSSFFEGENFMRRQILLASVGAIAITGSAFAADLRPPPYYPPPPPIFTWSGLYMGGQVGYTWGSDPIDEVDTVFGDDAFFNTNPSGVIGGAHLGYNLQIGQWVAGLEATVDGTSKSGTAFDVQPNNLIVPGVTMSTRAEVEGSIRARVGYAINRILIYGTGGAAFAGITDGYINISPALSETDSKTRSGWTVGGGVEYAITDNWSVRAEYRYSDFGRSPDFPFPTLTLGNVSFTHHLTQNQVQAGFSYRFTPFAPVPVVAKY